MRVPKAAHGAYVKFNRRAQDWAIVGVAAVVDGASARIALTGVGPRPVRAEAAERAFTGANAAEAAEHAAEGLDAARRTRPARRTTAGTWCACSPGGRSRRRRG